MSTHVADIHVSSPVPGRRDFAIMAPCTIWRFLNCFPLICFPALRLVYHSIILFPDRRCQFLNVLY